MNSADDSREQELAPEQKSVKGFTSRFHEKVAVLQLYGRVFARARRGVAAICAIFVRVREFYASGFIRRARASLLSASYRV